MKTLLSTTLGMFWLTAAPVVSQDRGLWETRPRLNIARQEVGAAVLRGRVYVGGGLGINRGALASVERFDPARNKWDRVADLPTTLHHFGMAEAGAKIYAVGGYVTHFNSQTSAVYAYDESTNRWSTVAPLPRPRGALAAATVGGKIYAVGGVVLGVGPVGDLTEYDPATNRWVTRAPMPTPREHLAVGVVNGRLLVAGGRTSQNLDILEEYDPGRDRWAKRRPMPTARGGNGAAVLHGRLIVVGGEGLRIFPEAEEYDPSSNSWRTLSPMPSGLHGIYPVTLGDEIIVPGGGTQPGFAASDLVLAFRFKRPSASVAVTPSVVKRSGAFTFSAGLSNPGRTRKVDVYLGYLSPFGPVASYGPGLILRPFTVVTPSFRAVSLSERLSIPTVPLIVHPAAFVPPGPYLAFAALTAVDAFKDGRIDPGDLLSLVTAGFTVQ